MTPDASGVALDARLRSWSQAGLISQEQARSIAEWERQRGSAPKPSMAVEALAYVGGAVIVAAIVVITADYWVAMSTAGRIAIPAAAALLTLIGGGTVPGRWGDLGVRMRAALWLITPVAMLAVMTAVTEAANLDYPDSLLIDAAPVFAIAAALYLLHRSAAQQVAAFVATQMILVALVQWRLDYDGSWIGLVIAVVSILWGVLAITRLLPGTGRWAPAAGSWGDAVALTDRHGRWGLGLAAVGAVWGGIILTFGGSIAWAGVIPVAVVVAVGVARSDLTVLIIGAVGTLIVLPAVTDEYLDSTLATAAVLLVVGAAMVTLAIMVGRHRARRAPTAPPDGAGAS